MKKSSFLLLTTAVFLTSFLLTLSVLSSSTWADVKEKSWEVSGFGGFYLMEGNQWLADAPTYGGKIGYFFTRELEVELTVGYVPTEFDINNSIVRSLQLTGLEEEDVNLLNYRIEVLYHFEEVLDRIVPYLALGAGIAHLDSDYPTLDNELEAEIGYGLGMKIFLLDSLALRADVRGIGILDKYIKLTKENGVTVYRESSFFNNLEATLGLSYLFGGKTPDSDNDGIADKVDSCPDTPANVTVDARGCPVDSDKDRVFDGIDQCPNTPRGAKVNMKGCPLDSDGDGVFDGLDLCPDTPANASINKDGCPLDSDGDGIFDGLDRCPQTLAGLVVNDQGCPLDSDGDGVLDGVDRCPDTKAGIKIDAYGCSIIQQEEEVVLYGITFKTNSSQILPQSFPHLNDIAKALKHHPQIIVEIGGHSDSVGKAAYNQQLSLKRANSVKQYLVGKGISGSRIITKGYGESRPIDTNKTKEGRAKNRRIEFKVLKR